MSELTSPAPTYRGLASNLTFQCVLKGVFLIKHILRIGSSEPEPSLSYAAKLRLVGEFQ